MTEATDQRPHTLYRFYDEDGSLLYVGITCRPSERWKRHAAGKPWWLDVAEVRLQHYLGRDAVLTAEVAAIQTEYPRYNIVGAVGQPSEPGPVDTWLLTWLTAVIYLACGALLISSVLAGQLSQVAVAAGSVVVLVLYMLWSLVGPNHRRWLFRVLIMVRASVGGAP